MIVILFEIEKPLGLRSHVEILAITNPYAFASSVLPSRSGTHLCGWHLQISYDHLYTVEQPEEVRNGG